MRNKLTTSEKIINKLHVAGVGGIPRNLFITADAGRRGAATLLPIKISVLKVSEPKSEPEM